MRYKMIGMGSDLRPDNTPQTKVGQLPTALEGGSAAALVKHLDAVADQADQVLVFTGSLSELAEALPTGSASTLQTLVQQGRTRLARKTAEREHKDWSARKQLSVQMRAKLQETP